MAPNDMTNIHNHGIAVDTEKKRIKCNYCEKVVSGFYRLKFHLAKKGSDVAPCKDVPAEVQGLFGKHILEMRRKKSHKVDENQELPNLPLKRKLSQETHYSSYNQINRFKDLHSFERDLPRESSGVKTRASTRLGNNNVEDCSITEVRNYLYDMGNDFNAIQLTSLQKMITTLNSSGHPTYDSPSCQGLRLSLDYSLKQTHNYVNALKETWETTGCSILLDGWMDSMDQCFVHILVSCPKGVIYLKSSNISTLVGNVDAMVAFFEEVIQEVGVKNVVQIIRNSTLDIMEKEVGSRIMEKHAHIFWTMSASNCIELVLEEFKTMQLIRRVLKQANIILNFIHNHGATLKIFSTWNSFHDLVKPSRINSLVPYLTLENVVEKKDILKNLFNSYEWGASNLSTSSDGKIIVDILESSAFWRDANVAVKASLPLLDLVRSLYKNDKPLTGYIYEEIDQAKQKIRNELKHDSLYKPFWRAIDNIWNKKLHTKLHSAGYYFNPCLYYSNNFLCDPKVASGMSYVSCMITNQYIKSLVRYEIAQYIWMRRTCSKSALDNPTNSSPVRWWLTHGGIFPQLKKIAIRIISQTCDGACKFGLKRDLGEMLLGNEGSLFEQDVLKDLAFVHYNLQLQNFYPNVSNKISIGPLSDWIIEEQGRNIM